MNKQEFINRTGDTDIDDERFELVNDIYLESGDDLDKDAFCRDWSAHRDSTIIQGLHKCIRAGKDKENRLASRVRTLEDGMLSIADFLVERYQKTNDARLYEKAVELTSLDHVICVELEMGAALSAEEAEHVVDILRNYK